MPGRSPMLRAGRSISVRVMKSKKTLRFFTKLMCLLPTYGHIATYLGYSVCRDKGGIPN